jgi:hypothetical protein
MTARRYDLDWLRIAAFGVLIFYHVGMFYVSWDWHVKSSRASEAIEPLMRLVNPWRLTLLFLISGVATRFIADRMRPGRLFLSRMGRLWPPLLLAVFVIVPPQAYYEIVEALAAMGAPQSPALDDFYRKYATASGRWCDADGCLTTPTYNHMWFVAYLILYTAAVIIIAPILRRAPAAVSRLIAGPGLILAPWLFLFLARMSLQPIFGETHDFRNDWYLHTIYFATFLFGYAVAKFDRFFDDCLKLRWPALAIAVVAWAALNVYYGAFDFEGSTPPEWLRIAMRGARELQAWTAIISAIGFARRYLRNSDGPVRRMLTEAIFPFYIIHQTIIVVAAHHLNKAGLPLAVEAPLLIGATLLGCWAFYAIGRALPAGRAFFGLAPGPRRQVVASIAAA